MTDQELVKLAEEKRLWLCVSNGCVYNVVVGSDTENDPSSFFNSKEGVALREKYAGFVFKALKTKTI